MEYPSLYRIMNILYHSKTMNYPAARTTSYTLAIHLVNIINNVFVIINNVVT